MEIVMHYPTGLLRYQAEDRSIRNVEDLSRHGRISRAFIRLCLSLGCPSVGGDLSLAMLLDWLFENYTAVRIASGLPSRVEVLGLPSAVAEKLKVGNAMVTLLEYSSSRSSDPVARKHLNLMIECIERALDR
jgi:hypothetical protein